MSADVTEAAEQAPPTADAGVSVAETQAPPVEVWPLPTGGSIPKSVTLGAIPGIRDHDERVTFRDPVTLKAGDRKAVIRAITSDSAGGAAVDIADGVLCLLIEHWTFNLPLPKLTPASLDLIEMADYDALARVADPVMNLLFPKADEPGPRGPSNG